MLLIGTADSVHYVIDAFDGNLIHRLTGFRGLGTVDENGKLSLKVQNRNGSGQEVCWSPDGRYVVGGAFAPSTLLGRYDFCQVLTAVLPFPH